MSDAVTRQLAHNMACGEYTLETFKIIMIKGIGWYVATRSKHWRPSCIQTHRKRKKGQQHSELLYGFHSLASCFRDACSFHLVLASKEVDKEPHKSQTVWAEIFQQELSSGMGRWSPPSQHPTGMLASGTAGHITICSWKWTPSLLLSALTEFSRKQPAFQA